MARGRTSFMPFGYEEEDDLYAQADALAALGGEPVPLDEPAFAADLETAPIDATQAPGVQSAPLSVSNGQPVAEDALDPMEALSQRFSAPPPSMSQQPMRTAPRLPAPPKAEGIPLWSLLGGGIADLLLNKGRNAGRFISAIGEGDSAVDYENYKRQVDNAKAQSAIDNAYAGRGRGISPEQLEMQRIRAMQAQERLGIQSAAQKTAALNAEQRKKQWDELNTVGSATHAAMVEFAVANGIPRAQIEGLPAAQASKTFPAINEYLKSTGAIGDARTAHDAETARAQGFATIDPAAQKAGAVAAAQQPYELEKIAAAEGAKESARRAMFSAPIPGLVVRNQSAYEMAAADDATRRKLQDISGAYRGMLSSLDEMEALRKEFGPEYKTKAAADYSRQKGNVISTLSILANTGVINEGEWKRFSESIPDMEWKWEDILLAADKDVSLEQLQGAARAMEQNIQNKLYPYGVEYDTSTLPRRQGGKKPAGKKAPAQAAPEAPPAGKPVNVDFGKGWVLEE